MRCLCFCPKSPSVGDEKESSSTLPEKVTASAKEDPRIPLSAKQKFLLTKNWKGISRQVCETGVQMFVK